MADHEELTPAQQERLHADAQRLREKMDARMREIQAAVGEWLHGHTKPSEAVTVGIALARMAIGGYIDLFDEETAREMVEREFQRAIERRKDGWSSRRSIGNG